MALAIASSRSSIALAVAFLSMFERDATALEEQPDRRWRRQYGALRNQTFADLHRGDIRLFRDKPRNERLCRVQLAAALRAMLARFAFAVVTPRTMPPNSPGNTDCVERPPSIASNTRPRRSLL